MRVCVSVCERNVNLTRKLAGHAVAAFSNNLLYAREDEARKALVFACKNCNLQKDVRCWTDRQTDI